MTPAAAEDTSAGAVPAPPSGEGSAPSLRQTVHKIAWEIDNDHVPPGDLAALRRARPGDLGGPPFWKIAVRHLEPAGELPHPSARRRDEAERRWSVILGGMAEMAGLHQPGARLGRVLADAKVAEDRVLRLLRAHDEPLWRTARALTHQLASGGHRLDWADLAALIVHDGGRWEDQPRRTIALDYYRSHGD